MYNHVIFTDDLYCQHLVADPATWDSMDPAVILRWKQHVWHGALSRGATSGTSEHKFPTSGAPSTFFSYNVVNCTPAKLISFN